MRMQLYVAAVVANAVRAPPQPPRGAPLTPQWPRPLPAPPPAVPRTSAPVSQERLIPGIAQDESFGDWLFFSLPGCHVHQSFVPFAY